MSKPSLVVIDIEATCWPPGDPKRKKQSQLSEIIELYALKLNGMIHTDSLYSICNHQDFHQLIKPRHYPILTPFCQELTGLTQEQVNQAPPIEQVLTQWLYWINQDFFYLASWGTMDHQLLMRFWRETSENKTSKSKNRNSNPQVSSVPILPWQHLNIQAIFESCARAHRREQTLWFAQSNLQRLSGLSLKEGLAAIGEVFEGQAHQAKSDTLAALKCLLFACSKEALTPKEKIILQYLVNNQEQGHPGIHWGPVLRSYFANKQVFYQTIQSLITRLWLKKETRVEQMTDLFIREDTFSYLHS